MDIDFEKKLIELIATKFKRVRQQQLEQDSDQIAFEVPFDLSPVAGFNLKPSEVMYIYSKVLKHLEETTAFAPFIELIQFDFMEHK